MIDSEGGTPEEQQRGVVEMKRRFAVHVGQFTELCHLKYDARNNGAGSKPSAV